MIEKSKSPPNLLRIGLKTSVRYSTCGPIGTFVPPFRIRFIGSEVGTKRAQGIPTCANKPIQPAVLVSATNRSLSPCKGPGRNSKRVEPMFAPITLALQISFTSSTPKVTVKLIM